MTLKHYTAGSALPALDKDDLRLYSMQHEIVNVDLQKKPDWFTERTPHVGAVPVLEHGDGRIVYESLIICEYLDTIYPEHRLTPADPFVKAQHQYLIQMNSDITSAFYKLLQTKDRDACKDLDNALSLFENNLKSTFFGGEKEAMIDYMIWPWFERFPVLKNYEFDERKFPKLADWIQSMKNLSAVQKVASSLESHERFYNSYLTGKIDYDFELE